MNSIYINIFLIPLKQIIHTSIYIQTIAEFIKHYKSLTLMVEQSSSALEWLIINRTTSDYVLFN